MSDVNLPKSVKLWYSHRTGVTVREDCINLDQLKLRVKEGTLKWSPIDRPTSSANIQVTVAKAPSYSEAVPQMQVKRQSDIMGNVRLDTGIIKGLNKLLKLQLSDQPDLKKIFGDCVKINLSKKITELTKDKMTISVSLEVEGRGRGFSTATETKRDEYTGQFECEVSMHGQVIIDDNGQTANQQIHEVIRDLKASRPDEVCLFKVHPKEKEVTFPLKGKIEYLGDSEHKFVWDNVHS